MNHQSIAVRERQDGLYDWGNLDDLGHLNWVMSGKIIEIPEIKELNKIANDYFDSQNNPIVSEQFLIFAPVETVIIIKGEEEWEIMKERKPVSGIEFTTYLEDYNKTLKLS